jgi:hypothetical protein
MKKNLFNKFWLRVGMLVAVMTTALAGTVKAATVDDVLNRTWTGITSSSYSNCTGKTSTSSAVYAGNSAGGNTSIQLRSSSSSGIVTTTSGGKLKKISVEWNPATAENRVLDIYGKNTAYSAASDLYNTSNQGTKLGSITFDGQHATGELTVSGDYNFVGLRSANGAMYLTSITITWEPSGSSAVATTTTIDASGITNTDVYTGTSAGSLSATVTANGTAVSGATVAWSGDNNGVATINANTGVVTLVGAGSVKFTASYAGQSGVYLSSSAEYTMTVTDSDPTKVTFDATKDKDSNNTSQGEGSITKSGVTFSCSSGILGNGSEYRMYKNSTTTFSASVGTITKIVFVGTSGNPASGFTSQTGWTTNGNDGTWTGNAASVSFVASVAQVRATAILVTLDMSATSITADDVDIAYGATSGSITYTINNPVSGGVLTATTNDSWLTLGTVGETVPFTCSANNTVAERTANVTLTYTYNTNETVTKTITVTQAGNPNAVDNISDITAAGTYKVRGTIVAKSLRGFIVGDGTGYVYYYNANFPESNYNIGDKVKLEGSVKVYGGVYEFDDETIITAATESNYVSEEPTVLTGSQMDTRVESTTPAQLSTYVQYEGKFSVNVTQSGTHYNITNIDGASTAIGSISYPLNATALTGFDGKIVKVTGYYVGISSSTYYNTLIGSIEAVTTPVLSVTPAETNVDSEATSGTLNVTADNFSLDDVESSSIQYFVYNGSDYTAGSQPDWLTVEYDNENAVINYTVAANAGAARSAYFKLVLGYDDDYIYSDMITINQEAYVAPATDGTIVFGNNGTNITAASVTGDDSMGNTWTITSEGTTSYTQSTTYSQVGKAAEPATSITFTTTLPAEATITSFEAKFGGFKDTAGDVTLKVGENTVGTGSLNGTADVIVSNTSTATGTTLTVTVTNIAKGVKCYYISYEVSAPTSQTVTVSPAGYATIVAAANLEIPTGVEVYAAKVNEGATSAQLTAVTDGIPAGAAVLVKASAGTYEFTYTTETVAEITNNELVAATAAVTADGTQYCLAQIDGVVGFYKVDSGLPIPAGKAYLVVTSSAGQAKAFYGFDDDATGIETIDNGQLTTDNGVIYNLAGQRLQKMQRGINIVNGKKILK